jgi:hypothetical protein
MMHMQRQADLPEVVLTLDTSPALSGGIHSGKQETDQDADDPHHHNQFDKSEPLLSHNNTSQNTGPFGLAS